VLQMKDGPASAIWCMCTAALYGPQSCFARPSMKNVAFHTRGQGVAHTDIGEMPYWSYSLVGQTPVLTVHAEGMFVSTFKT
jgi:hypothetical protein